MLGNICPYFSKRPTVRTEQAPHPVSVKGIPDNKERPVVLICVISVMDGGKPDPRSSLSWITSLQINPPSGIFLVNLVRNNVFTAI